MVRVVYGLWKSTPVPRPPRLRPHSCRARRAPRSPFCRAADMAIDKDPFCGSRAPFQRQFANHRIVFEAIGGELSTAGQHAQRDRQVKGGSLFGKLRRGQVDHDPIVGPLESAVDDRPFDAMRALPHGRLGQPHQNRLGIVPGETSTSTSTGTASIPRRENVYSLANMLSPHVGPRFPSASHAHCAAFPTPCKPPPIGRSAQGDTRLSPEALDLPPAGCGTPAQLQAVCPRRVVLLILQGRRRPFFGRSPISARHFAG